MLKQSQNLTNLAALTDASMSRQPASSCERDAADQATRLGLGLGWGQGTGSLGVLGPAGWRRRLWLVGDDADRLAIHPAETGENVFRK